MKVGARFPLLLLLLAALAGSSKPVVAPLAMNNHVVIFLPGLYGSSLRDRATGALRWPSLREILLRRRPLVVCGAADDPAQPCDALVAGEVVDQVTLVPGVYVMDVYGDTLAKLRQALPGTTVKAFAYDWRLEITAQAAALDKLVDDERRQGHRVSIVAHSMGGLVASYWLRYGAQPAATAREDWSGAAKVDHVVLAGVPYGGSVMSFVDLVDGRKVAGNATIMNATAYRSFASTWQLLPEDAQPLLDEDFQAIDAPLLDAATWQTNEWGGFATATGARRGDASLAQARRLKQLLQQPIATLPAKKIDVLVIQGEGRGTLDKVVWRKDGSLVHDRDTWDAAYGKGKSSRVLYVDGDAVVSQAAGKLPEPYARAFAVHTLGTRKGHRQLLLDDTVVQRAAALLRGEATVAQRTDAPREPALATATQD